MLVFPVAGRLIRDPFTRRPVPFEGQVVDPRDGFWARALAAGDVISPSPVATPLPLSAAAAAPSDKGDRA